MIGERLPFNSLWADHNLYRGQPPVLCSIRLRPFQKGLVRWSRHRLTRHHVTITIIIIASYIQERRHWSRRSDSNTFQLVILLPCSRSTCHTTGAKTECIRQTPDILQPESAPALEPGIGRACEESQNHREGVQNLLSPEESKKSLAIYIVNSWKTRNTLAPKIGKGKYVLAEYEKIKRITMPLDDRASSLPNYRTRSRSFKDNRKG